MWLFAFYVWLESLEVVQSPVGRPVIRRHVPIYARVVDIHGADDGVAGGAEAQDLDRDGHPVGVEHAYGGSQTVLVVRAAARSIFVPLMGVAQVVAANVVGDDVSPPDCPPETGVVAEGGEEIFARPAVAAQVVEIHRVAGVGLDVRLVTRHVAFERAEARAE